MESDGDEYPNMEKVQQQTFEEYLQRLEIQLLKKTPETWENKTSSELITKFSADNKGYQQNLEKILALEKKFIEKHVKFDAQVDEKVLSVIKRFRDSHYASGYASGAKIQSTLVTMQLEMAAWSSELTTEEGTYGDSITAALLSNATGFYEAFIKPVNMKLAIPVVKNSLTKNKGKLSETLNTPCTTTLQYINMSAPKLINENAGLFWQIGLKTENKSLITSLAGKCANFKKEFTESITDFLTFYENELSATEKLQCQGAIAQCCDWGPDKCIPKLSVIVEEIEGMNKYYGAQALEKLAKKFPDEVFKHEQTIEEHLLTDKDFGYFGGQVFGAMGQYSQNKETITKCVKVLLDAIKADQINNVALLASGIKAIAQGGEKHKEILKKDFDSQLQSLKSSQNAQLAEQINQTLDIIHERSLEKVEVKMDELKKELVDYVDSKIEDIKKNYNNAVKTLPMPVDIEVKKNILNTIFLKFECAKCKNEDCKYPGKKQEEGEFFKTKTREVNKWCKVAGNVFSLGKSVFAGDVAGALGALAETYGNATSDDKGAGHFKALMEEPFLTSSEQDRLILQLREAKYFNSFSFQADVNGWVCFVCHPFERKEEPGNKQQSCACNIF